jgi:hypothetical protein
MVSLKTRVNQWQLDIFNVYRGKSTTVAHGGGVNAHAAGLLDRRSAGGAPHWRRAAIVIAPDQV